MTSGHESPDLDLFAGRFRESAERFGVVADDPRIERLFTGLRLGHCSSVPGRLTLDGKLIPKNKRETNREVFGWKRFIVKVGAQFGSATEIKLWSTIRQNPVDRRYFCPVVAWGLVCDPPLYDAWVAMPVLPVKRAVYTYSDAEWRAAWGRLEPIAKKYHLLSVRLERTPEQRLKPHNWTIFKGNPVIIDYGSPIYPPSPLSRRFDHIFYNCIRAAFEKHSKDALEGA